MREIFTWSYGMLAAMAGGLAVIVTQSPAAENKNAIDSRELIRAEILLDQLVDGLDSQTSAAARIMLDHWRERRYLAEFQAPIRINVEAEKQDDDRLEREMKTLAEVGAARSTAAGQPQYQTQVSECLSDHEMCVKDAGHRFTCITISTMCLARTLIPFVKGAK